MRRRGETVSVTKQHILQLLRTAPEGLSSKEIATELGAGSDNVGGRLSKMAAYGEIEKITAPSPSGKTKWLLRTSTANQRLPKLGGQEPF